MESVDGNDTDSSLCTPPRSSSPEDSANTNVDLVQAGLALRLLNITLRRPAKPHDLRGWGLKPTRGVDSATGLTWELQTATCNHRRYSQLQLCFGCSRQAKAVDEGLEKPPTDCRFQRIRSICISKGDEAIQYLPASSVTGFTEALQGRVKKAHFPRYLFGQDGARDACMEAFQASVAVHLLPRVQRELEHAQSAASDARFVAFQPDERITCDACEAVILFGSFVCAGCARETCLDCPPLEGSNSCENACCEQNARLGISTFVRVIRLRSDEIVVEIDALSQVIDAATTSGKTAVQHQNEAAQQLEIDPDLWLDWKAGRPLKLNVSKEDFNWDRDRLSKEYGSLSCVVEAIGAEGVQNVTLAALLDALVDPSGDKGLGMKSMQARDWPHEARFSQALPQPYLQFITALPARPLIDGAFAVSSWHAQNGNKPDLGPMVNIASAGDNKDGTKAICRNVADTVNLLAWTDGEGALITVWRHEDSAIIDDYFAAIGKNLHDGTSFATEADVAALEKLGAKAWTCIQKPGDMVYVPSGCANQMQNLGSCINITLGFLSITSLERALALTNEVCALKRLGKQGALQIDLLGMNRQLWWAWKLCQCGRLKVGTTSHDYDTNLEAKRVEAAGELQTSWRLVPRFLAPDQVYAEGVQQCLDTLKAILERASKRGDEALTPSEMAVALLKVEMLAKETDSEALRRGKANLKLENLLRRADQIQRKIGCVTVAIGNVLERWEELGLECSDRRAAKRAKLE